MRVYRTVDPGVGPSSSASGAGRQDDDGVAGAGARLDTAPPARQVDAHSRPGPASTIASTARARLLEQNAEQQRALLTEVQSAGAERKRGIMAALRDLAAKADELRKRTDPGLVEPAIGDPRARLLELQREVRDLALPLYLPLLTLPPCVSQAASLGIDTQGPPSRGPDLLSRAGSARPRQSSRRHAQQFRLDNRSRNLLIGPLEQDAVLSSLRAHLEVRRCLSLFSGRNARSPTGLTLGDSASTALRRSRRARLRPRGQDGHDRVRFAEVGRAGARTPASDPARGHRLTVLHRLLVRRLSPPVDCRKSSATPSCPGRKAARCHQRRLRPLLSASPCTSNDSARTRAKRDLTLRERTRT